jgi:pimeloyl-ACP methyl ester carboxylesterase/DNA-binding CsgD family transcriptional regulator
MEPPPVQYFTTRDGVSIAYSVSGAGRPLVIVGPVLGGMAHLWRFFPGWMEQLCARFLVMQHDLHGHGMSDRGLPDDYALGSDEKVIDALTDHLRFDRVILLGLSGVGHAAVRYAVARPDRVDALILLNTQATLGMQSLFRDVAAENWDFFLRSMVPQTLGPEAARLWFESFRESTNHADWLTRINVAAQSNIEAKLSLVSVPTLVLHSRELTVGSAEAVRKLASLVPGARLVTISGDGVMGDAAEGIQAIERFLAEAAPTDARQDTYGGGLSIREIEVLRLLSAGKSNQDIADELVISLNTVRRHVSNIFDKTGVANRAEAATYAARNGIS